MIAKRKAGALEEGYTGTYYGDVAPPKPKTSRKYYDVAGRRAVILNMKISELGRRKKWEEILRLYKNEREDFDNVNYSSMMIQFGRIESLNRNDPMFIRFVDDIANNMEERGFSWMDTIGVTNIVYTIGKMKLNSKGSRRILELVLNEKNIEMIVRKATARDIANIAWAFANLGIKSLLFFTGIDYLSDLLIKNGNTRDVSNIVWAFAALDITCSTLLNAIEMHSKDFVRIGNERDITNAVWACGSLGFKCPSLLDEVDKISERLMHSGNPRNVANVAWASATLDIHLPGIFSRIDANAYWLVNKGTQQDVCNIAWSCARVGMKTPVFFGEIEKRAEWLARGGDPQNISNTVWAATQLRYYMPNLLAEANKNWEKIINSRAQHVSNCLLAFATFDFKADTCISALGDNVKNWLDQSRPNTQSLCNICYSLVILDSYCKHEDLFRTLWGEILEKDPNDFADVEIGQLSQIEIYLTKMDCFDIPGLPRAIRNRMKNIHHDDYQSEYSETTSDQLTDIGFFHEKEVSPLLEGDEITSGDNNDGNSKAYDNQCKMMLIDLACRKRRVAIECDGPYHYLVSIPSGKVTRMEDGQTKAKRRFLERNGWTVINLSYHDRRSIRNTGGDIKKWLRQELEKKQISVEQPLVAATRRRELPVMAREPSYFHRIFA